MAASLSGRGRGSHKKLPALRGNRRLWHGRSACVLGNELVQLTQLTGGGHIVDFHFTAGGRNKVNPFWQPRWKSLEPLAFTPGKHGKVYGTPEVGKLLCGIAGHSLCLDLFGAPSPEQARHGRTLHGEAGVSRWKTSLEKSAGEVTLSASVRLPGAGLSFARTVLLKSGETIAYIRETAGNERNAAHFFQWQQHVVLGPPFLSSANCVVNLPGARGLTYPSGYEGHELLKNNREFSWPHAPRFDRGSVDMRRPLTTPGRGFVAGVQITPNRSHGFICGLNTKLCVAFGYCFRRDDFPWVALWEENAVRRYPPWNGREKVRGLEFGTSPLPLPRTETFRLGKLFGTPTFARLPARKRRTASYLLFLAQVPQGTHTIADVAVRSHSLDLIAASGKKLCSVSGSAIAEYLA